MSSDMSNQELATALSEFKKWLETPIDSFSKSKKKGKGTKEKTKKGIPKKDSKGRFIKEKGKTESMDEVSDSEEHKTDSSSGDESQPKPKAKRGKGKRSKEPTTAEQDTQDKFVHSRGKKQKQIVVEPIQTASQVGKDGGGVPASSSVGGSAASSAKSAAAVVRGPRF